MLKYQLYAKRNLISNLVDQIEIKKLGFSLDEMILSCDFRFKKCSNKYFKYYFHKIYGNCFSFNSGMDENGNIIELLRVTKNGRLHGLELSVFIGLADELQYLNPNLGAIVFIHNHTTSALNLDGIIVGPNTETDIGITRTFINQMPKPYSECESQTFDSEVSKLTHKLYNGYRQNDCVDLCFQLRIIETCNCSVFELPDIKNVRICSSEREENCSLETYEKIVNNQENLNDKCLEECPLECNTMSFSFKISSTQFMNNFYEKTYLSQSRIKKLYEFNKLNTSLRENLAKIIVYYETLDYTEMEESASTDFAKLLSDIGGIAGLFLGISVLSTVELFEIVMRIIFLLKENKNVFKKKLAF